MVGIGDSNKVNEKTMNWLKNGGKALLLETVEKLNKELKDRKLIGDFLIDLYIEGEHPNEGKDILVIGDPEDEEADEEAVKNWEVPKGTVEYNIDWYGHQGAYFILSELERICIENGVQPVIDKDATMRMAFVTMSVSEKALKEKFGEVKAREPYLVSSGREGSRYLRKDEMIDMGKYIEEKRRKNPDTGYLFDPELGHIRIECPSLEDGKWLVYLGNRHDCDTLMILCTDIDIRKINSNVIRAYKIPESEIGDKENIIIYEDLNVSSEWEKFREDEKKYDGAYKELKKDRSFGSFGHLEKYDEDEPEKEIF